MSDPGETHRGSCHCGAVKFTVNGPITRAMTCTCSVCSQIGAIWHGTSNAGLTLHAGEEQLAVYQFGTMTAKHYFCRTCGIHPFTRPRLDPKNLWAVNLRCVEGMEPDKLPTMVFDGANWERAAQDLMARLAKGGA